MEMVKDVVHCPLVTWRVFTSNKYQSQNPMTDS